MTTTWCAALMDNHKNYFSKSARQSTVEREVPTLVFFPTD